MMIIVDTDSRVSELLRIIEVFDDFVFCIGFSMGKRSFLFKRKSVAIRKFTTARCDLKFPVFNGLFAACCRC